jgi:4-amino-4-deoxy-L-arabinose transferase-like glycosyltransferase
MLKLYRISVAKQINSEDNYLRFRQYATIFLGGLTGLLIFYPLATSYFFSPVLPYLIFAFSFIAGALVGYRRRNSGIFLYFCMIAIIILAVVISSSQS